MANKVLVVDDEKLIVKGIKFSLEQDGMEVTAAYDGKEAYELAMQNDYDIILLDVMLPELNGFEVCQMIREKSDVPIIMLTAKGDDMDKILGLEYGADDYVTKPFTPLELLARVNSQLRRYRRFMEKLGDKEKTQNIHVIGGLELDEERVEVRVDGELVKVTPMEYKILLLLMKNPGRVFSADEIYERVWNERAVNTDTIMVHVRNIREKIEINPKEPKYLKVVWGVGYKMEKQ
mgnify:CR=1 FL=1